MKRILVLAAALALSATAATAACLGHNDTTASADPVNREITTASVTKTEQSKPADELLLQQKLQQEEATAED
ncbi:hypothetical protein N181_12110 [Sinorhizobium fredii USDA 205]|uniref:Lipoprotein n=2 Tax=Rhizobium fredii TaxID=380 RepID=A0A2A6LZ41_RHIFR|nr:hypothetical protein [Sinorhizobium fredii]ASY68373.1 hypothetical protein SF83666_c09350 [Sinorhizobium fredii CCBAU 83666]AWM24440.1 hypothetical protein AOX55_00001165 [Sinorhizobium fredii CCBAU 25509]KSV90392.1 hypothetical protein N181_12110 [Sinorhizobium fredii USDA 205]MCG5475902.1 hypothetical protein [Sinorhizobium fredii]MQW96632.1 hypothetical protein [Sinorhizobium fredii]